MSREDATFLFLEKNLDLDTDLGISVSGDPQKIRPVVRFFWEGGWGSSALGRAHLAALPSRLGRLDGS